MVVSKQTSLLANPTKCQYDFDSVSSQHKTKSNTSSRIQAHHFLFAGSNNESLLL